MSSTRPLVYSWVGGDIRSHPVKMYRGGKRPIYDEYGTVARMVMVLRT
jgi:hypothetical protein